MIDIDFFEDKTFTFNPCERFAKWTIIKEFEKAKKRLQRADRFLSSSWCRVKTSRIGQCQYCHRCRIFRTIENHKGEPQKAEVSRKWKTKCFSFFAPSAYFARLQHNNFINIFFQTIILWQLFCFFYFLFFVKQNGWWVFIKKLFLPIIKLKFKTHQK